MNAHDLIDRMIYIGAKAVDSGLVLGSGGNLSVRHPERNAFIVTNSGTMLDELTRESFTEVSLDDPQPGAASSEWKLHAFTYRDRPDVNAIVHLHPQYCILLAALGKPIRFFSLDDAFYVARYSQIPFFPNGSDELGEASAQACAEANCVILENHGCSCVAGDIDMAYRRAALLEQAAQNTYRALLLGDTQTSFGEGVELIHR